MSLIQLENVHKSFGANAVLRGITWKVEPRCRIGLVGRNGCGKTTLFYVLTGAETPDRGAVHRTRGLKVAYLSQAPGFEPASTVFRSALAGFQDLLEVQSRLRALEDAMAAGETARERLEEYGRLCDQYRREGGYSLEARAKAVLSGLGFAESDLDKQVDTLSGGQKNRLALAQLLAKEPDLLLLDEPTNHLDLRTVEWLEGYLGAYRGAFVVVSHDRYFLDRAVTEIVELDAGVLSHYAGTFSYFSDEKEKRGATARKVFEAQQAHIQKTEAFIRKNIAGQKTKQAQSRRKALDRLERLDRPRGRRDMALSFAPRSRGGDRVLEVSGVSKAFGDLVLFENLSLVLTRGDRLGVVGPNGSGKTTLLRLLSDRLDPDSGSVRLGSGIEIGNYDQDRRDLNEARTVLEEIWEITPGALMGEIKTVCGAFLFSGDDAEQKVGALSGGEQARVALAKLLRGGSNLLILDEPTNHLDIPSRTVLEAALERFGGTFVAVSHDRYFLNRLVDRLLVLEQGRWALVEGNYDAWQRRGLEEEAAVVRDNAQKGERKSAYKMVKRNERAEERRRRTQIRIQEEIGEMEAAVRLLDEEMRSGDVASDWDRLDEIDREKARIQEEIEVRFAAWEKLAGDGEKT